MRGLPARYSVRNLVRRPVRTFLTVAGLSLLVALIVFLVAFGRSFGKALREPGHPRNIVVLSKKAQTIELSSIAASDLKKIRNSLTAELETGKDGRPLFSREVYHMVNAVMVADPAQKPRRSLFHGADPVLAQQMFSRFKLTTGSLPRANQQELIVGRAVASRTGADPEWLAIGQEVILRGKKWKVVGEFEAPGTLYENWMISHPNVLQITLNRSDYSFGRMRVKEGVDVAALSERLTADERYEIQALPEPEYFADFAEGFSHFENFAVALAVLMGIAGLITGMNTLHNAIVGRTREIGMLRVLGFGKTSITAAFLLEAMLLTGLAGLLGCGISFAANGLPVKVPTAAAFPVVIDAQALAAGFAAALLMGILGLAWPMFRALRMPPVEAVRAV